MKFNTSQLQEMNLHQLTEYNAICSLDDHHTKFYSPAQEAVFTALTGPSGLNTDLCVTHPETLSPVQ